MRNMWMTLALLASCALAPVRAQDATPAPMQAPSSGTPGTAASAANGTPVAADSAADSATGTGTLVVEARMYSSEKPLPAKVDAQLRTGGIEWGLQDHLLVVSTVNKQFVNYPITHLTRFGQSETLALPAGDYRITGIGLEANFGFNVLKLLDKGAFVNEDAVAFRIEPGKTTTLRIDPVFAKDNAGLVNFWLPSYMASVVTEAGATGPTALNVRGDASIGWKAYHGPLKFPAK